jgi:hypothetical protein
MKIVLFIFLSFLGVNLNQAHASVDTWNCQLNGEISGIKLGFVFGGQYLGGEGVIYCVESTNPQNEVRIPVKMKLVGGGWGFDFTLVESVRVVSAGVGNLSGPESFFGSFNVGATAGLTLINQGINADAAIRLSKNRSFGLELGLMGEDAIGLGVRLHGLVFVIKPKR